MAVDLNRVAEKLKRQRPVGVTRDGQITHNDPMNDGSRQSVSGHTTLTPKRFFTK